MKPYCLSAAVSAICLSLVLQAQTIVVDTSVETGPVKILNGVNGGPATTRPFAREMFKAARIPIVRNHDIADRYDGYIVDISMVFPDFSANVDKPESYDFTFTDNYIKILAEVGAKCYYRLGQTIENGTVPHNIFPPKNYLKWAKICEHIIRHYTEGWADGYHYDMDWWQIWNEHDANDPNGCWAGTEEEFFDFYETVSKYLKKTFPELKIGGPALIGKHETATRFVEAMAKRNVPLDFLSWHWYGLYPDVLPEHCKFYRQLLDDNGYAETLSVLDEWNVKPFDMILTTYGAVFVAACMTIAQTAPVDMMLYYDTRFGTRFNNFYDVQGNPRKGYWAFYSWANLRDMGPSVRTVSDDPEVYAVAARDPETGELGMLVVRMSEKYGLPCEKSVNGRIPRTSEDITPVKIRIDGMKARKATVQMVDEDKYDFGNFPYEMNADSTGTEITVKFDRRAFAYIELR